MSRRFLHGSFILFVAACVLQCNDIVDGFQLGKVLSRFGAPRSDNVATNKDFSIPSLFNNKVNQVQAAKTELLQTISSTKNGKESSLETQKHVLGLVRFLETESPASPTLLTNPSEAMKTINGIWYLQYTQPSDIGVSEIPSWKPEPSSRDVVSKLDTRQVNNQGTVSFLGTVAVDTSDRLTTQTIDVQKGMVTNFVDQDKFTVEVSGSYELDSVPNRVIVTFNKCEITFKYNGFVLDLSFLFDLRSFLKGGLRAGGWLETTYIDEEIRIGRGNRGSLFVLTRDRNAVTP